MPKKDKPVDWGKAIKVALKQDAIIKSVFCARCVWLISKLVTKKFNSTTEAMAKKHYLRHVGNALETLVMQDKKIVAFKEKKKPNKKR